MSDLVENPEDRFSHNEAQIQSDTYCLLVFDYSLETLFQRFLWSYCIDYDRNHVNHGTHADFRPKSKSASLHYIQIIHAQAVHVQDLKIYKTSISFYEKLAIFKHYFQYVMIHIL